MRREKNIRNLKPSDFYCTNCGKKNISILRKVGKQREIGHLKKLYCFHCGQEVNMVEIKHGSSQYTIEDFEIEFNFGNFINGERQKPYRQFRAELRSKGVI